MKSLEQMSNGFALFIVEKKEKKTLTTAEMLL
jgi:hypothetical protein